MKKSLLYSLMFVFAFILPSFTKIPDKDFDKTVLQTTSDSVTVNVKFSNPELTINDDRLVIEERFNSQLLSDKELVNVVKEVSKNFSDFVYLQERRYEPAMVQLQQKTGYSVGQINKFIRQKQTLNNIMALGLILYLLAIIIIYVTSYRRLREQIIGMLILFIFSGVVFCSILFLCWPALMGHNYILFYKLLELSPI